MATLRPIDDHTRQQLNSNVRLVEDVLEADAIAIASTIFPGLDIVVKRAIEHFSLSLGRDLP